MRSITLHPRTALVLQHVEERLREKSTLEQIFDNTVIKWYASGDELTKAQRGLVAATVSLMQDRLLDQLKSQADDLRQTLEQQRYFFQLFATGLVRTFRGLYTTQLFALTANQQEQVADEHDIPEEPKKKSVFNTVFTWGNLVAATAIVIAMVATFYTKAYASYKDRADSLAASFADSHKDLTALKTEKTSVEGHLTAELERTKSLSSDRDYWKTTAETREATIETKNDDITKLTQQVGVQKGQEQLGAELKAAKEDLDKAKQKTADYQAENARLKQEVAGEQEQRNVYKKMADDERKRSSEKLMETDRLHKENREMTAKLDRLRNEIRSLGYVPGA